MQASKSLDHETISIHRACIMEADVLMEEAAGAMAAATAARSRYPEASRMERARAEMLYARALKRLQEIFYAPD